MKISYDAEVDALVIVLREGQVAESDEVAPGLIVDFDSSGVPLALEVLQARHLLSTDGTLQVELPITLRTRP